MISAGNGTIFLKIGMIIIPIGTIIEEIGMIPVAIMHSGRSDLCNSTGFGGISLRFGC